MSAGPKNPWVVGWPMRAFKGPLGPLGYRAYCVAAELRNASFNTISETSHQWRHKLQPSQLVRSMLNLQHLWSCREQVAYLQRSSRRGLCVTLTRSALRQGRRESILSRGGVDPVAPRSRSCRAAESILSRRGVDPVAPRSRSCRAAPRLS